MDAKQALPTNTDAAFPNNGKPLVELKNMCKYFGNVRALDGVDFQIHLNEVQGLVGDNGAGKSTLIKILSGAHQPTSGEVYFNDRQLQITSPSAAFDLGIATLYQDLALVEDRDLAENIFLGREPTRFGFWVDRKRMLRESRELMASLGQLNVSSVEMDVLNLSGGQRQAVALARIVHRGGKVLLLDEPTAALGIRESHEMLTLIEQLKSKDKAIVIVSHNLAHVFRVADRITVLRKGACVGSRKKMDTDANEIVKMITGAELL